MILGHGPSAVLATWEQREVTGYRWLNRLHYSVSKQQLNTHSQVTKTKSVIVSWRTELSEEWLIESYYGSKVETSGWGRVRKQWGQRPRERVGREVGDSVYVYKKVSFLLPPTWRWLELCCPQPPWRTPLVSLDFFPQNVLKASSSCQINTVPVITLSLSLHWDTRVTR